MDSDAFLWYCGFLKEKDKSEKLKKRKKKIGKKEKIFLKANVAIFFFFCHLSVATSATKIFLDTSMFYLIF